MKYRIRYLPETIIDRAIIKKKNPHKLGLTKPYPVRVLFIILPATFCGVAIGYTVFYLIS